MPRIAVNGASFTQRVTGVQRYAREMSARLLGHPDVRLLLASDPDDAVGPEGAEVSVLQAGRLGAWGWVNTALPRALFPDEVLWSPTIRAPLRVAHHVPTVHDLSVFDHPEWFRRPVVLQWRLLLPQLCRSSASIVTDSEFSKGRLVERLGLSDGRVNVVPCGVDPRFGSASPAEIDRVRERYDLPQGFILTVGSADPRKNLGLLLDAWRLLDKDLREAFPVVVVGGSERTFASDPALSRLPESARHLGYVDDADLPGVYAAATTFAYPSRYEGFGLPPLEAMASGTPVVGLQSTEAVTEVVGGGAGVLAADDSAEAFADALTRSLDPHVSHALQQAGRLRAASYTWEAAADRLLTVLENAAQ